MKIENVNDVIAFTRKAMEYGYNIDCFNYFEVLGDLKGFSHFKIIIFSVNSDNKIIIDFVSEKINISYRDTSAALDIPYKLTQKDKALLDLLAVDIDEYRANKMQNILDKFFEPEKDSDTNNLNDED